MKSYNNLWDKFLSDENILLAIKNACKHKMNRAEFRKLHDHPQYYIAWIRERASNFKNSYHFPKEIYDGIQRKKRTIIVPAFIEQIIHHMVVNILKPIFTKSFYQHSYASIPNRGAHLAKKYLERKIRKGKGVKYCFKCDIKKYFESIPHDKIKERLSKTIKDKKFLDVLFTIIDVIPKGIPLGFYVSQWIANWYLTPLDHFIKEKLHAKLYQRYMDDMTIFSSNKRELHRMKDRIVEFLKELGLELKDDWQIFRFSYKNGDDYKGRFLDYMGFRFYRDKVTLRRSLFTKACRKAKRIFKKQIDCVKISIYECKQIISYYGWFKVSDTFRAFNEVFLSVLNIRGFRKRMSNYDKVNNKKVEEIRKREIESFELPIIVWERTSKRFYRKVVVAE